MSKKRPKYLVANDVDEMKFQIEDERREFEENRNKPKVISRYARGNRVISSWNESCLWWLAKFILIPIVIIIFVAILKACSPN